MPVRWPNLNRRSRGYWPTGAQELLLKACLLPGDQALAAWRKWDAANGLERLDAGSSELLPLLYSNLAPLGIESGKLAMLKGTHRRSWSETRTLARKLAPVIQTLEDAGIPAILIKGAPLAFQFYSDAGCRPIRKLDILVPADNAVESLWLLEARGWRRREPPQGGEQLGFRHSVDLVDGQGRQVRLHWRVLDHFWDSAVPFIFEGVRSRTLCPTDHLLCATAGGLSRNSVRSIRWVADATIILRTSSIDWDRVVRIAGKLQIAPPVREKLKYLARLVKAPVPSEVLDSLSRIKGQVGGRKGAGASFRLVPKPPVDAAS